MIAFSVVRNDNDKRFGSFVGKFAELRRLLVSRFGRASHVHCRVPLILSTLTAARDVFIGSHHKMNSGAQLEPEAMLAGVATMREREREKNNEKNTRGTST